MLFTVSMISLVFATLLEIKTTHQGVATNSLRTMVLMDIEESIRQVSLRPKLEEISDLKIFLNAFAEH